MTPSKIASGAREILFALATVLVGFNLFPEAFLDDIVAAGVGISVLVWGIANKATDKAALGSFLRKAAVALSGIAVRLEWISNDQAGAIVTLIVTLAAMRFGWVAAAKNDQVKADVARRMPAGKFPE